MPDIFSGICIYKHLCIQKKLLFSLFLNRFKDVIGHCFEREVKKLETQDSYFNEISKELKPKRDRLASLLVEAGLTPIIPEGEKSYFF